jgi:hypothetical protein
MGAYVYIIRHNPSDRFYVGSQYGKNASSKSLLSETGYQTSSTSVRKLIEKDGLNSFSIVEIIEEEDLQIPFNDCRKVYEYETFLQEINEVNKSQKWLNVVVNNKYNFNYPLLIPETKAHHLQICQSPENKAKVLQGCIDKFGMHYSKTTDFKTFMTDYWEERGTNPYELCDKEKHREKMNDPIMWERIHDNWDKNWVGGHPLRDSRGIEKSQATNLSKYGVDNYAKSEEFREEMRTNNPMHLQVNIDSHRKAMAIVKETGKIKEALKHTPIIECPHCRKTGKGTGAMFQWHFDRCKQNPNGTKFIRAPRGSKGKNHE